MLDSVSLESVFGLRERFEGASSWDSTPFFEDVSRDAGSHAVEETTWLLPGPSSSAT